MTPKWRRGAAGVAEYLPGTLQATWTGAQETTGALQRLPDSTLLAVAAASMGIAVGFHLARVPRPIVVASLIPGVFMGVAIVLRPSTAAALAEHESTAHAT